MANEVFQVLASSTGAGESPRTVVHATTSVIGINAMPAPSFRDQSDLAVFPQLTSDGRIPVSLAATGTLLKTSGTATPGALNTDTDVTAITLTATETYRVEGFAGSGFHPLLWTLIQDDDGTDTELARWVTGPGDFNFQSSINCIEFTAGASGTQELKTVVQQLRGPLGAAHSFICALQLA